MASIYESLSIQKVSMKGPLTLNKHKYRAYLSGYKTSFVILYNNINLKERDNNKYNSYP